jgi:hypothetical protein
MFQRVEGEKQGVLGQRVRRVLEGTYFLREECTRLCFYSFYLVLRFVTLIRSSLIRRKNSYVVVTVVLIPYLPDTTLLQASG